MKKIVLSGIEKFEITECTEPRIINPDDVLLKIKSVGVCGSDMHYYKEGKIGEQVVQFPFPIGHECSAIVVDTGKDVTRVKKGDLVVVEPAVSCHKCPQCLAGREHTCLHVNFLGCPGQLDGCLGEYLVMPEHNCFPVPSSMNAEMAALVEPLSIGMYAGNFIKECSRQSSILIIGAGPIGLSVLLTLKSKGFDKIYVTDKLDYRVNLAKNNGAAWAGNPVTENVFDELKKHEPEFFDFVFECCGQQEALDFGVDILKPGGRLLIVGIPETDRISFDISKLRRKEISLQNVRRQNNCVQPVIDLISEGKIKPAFMITHRYSYNTVKEAFELVHNYEDNVIKAMINF